MKYPYTDIELNVMPSMVFCSPIHPTASKHAYPVGYAQQKLISSNWGKGFPSCHQCGAAVEFGWFLKSISHWVHFPCIDDLIIENREDRKI